MIDIVLVCHVGFHANLYVYVIFNTYFTFKIQVDLQGWKSDSL